jgi:radical SAM protein with 4Fe4S-binding SPASM domain
MSAFPYKIEQCVWQLTLRCNMRCFNCRSSGAPKARRELAPHECLRAAEQLIEQGCRQVTLIGGEVFLYEGWDRIARRLHDGGVRVDLVTNGLLSGRKQFDQLRRARPATVGVAIDGMEAGHERVRGVPGSFRRACDLVRRLRAEGFSVGVVTSLTDFNADDLPAMYDMLLGLGPEVWRIQLAAPAASQAGPVGLALGPRRIPEVTRFIAEKRAEGGISVCAGDDIGYYDKHEPLLRGSTAGSPPGGESGAVAPWRGCQAGLRGVAIDSAGNVRGCQALADERFIEGNLHTQTLAEIWRHPGAFSYNRRFHSRQLQGRCAGCDMGETCRAGCRSMCFSTTGRLYDNPYCCRQPTPVPVRLVARKGRARRPANQAQVQAQVQANNA